MAYESEHPCRCGCGLTVPATFTRGRRRRWATSACRKRAYHRRRAAELFGRLPAR
jgi:hypothetical protein